MKILLILLATLFFPNMVNASTEVLNFRETLAQENIEPLFEEYEETQDQITIYMFRRDGCSHCEDFLKFLNSIAKEYGYMFKLRSYEVLSNKDNSLFMDKISNYFGDNATGVPYIIIGNHRHKGFKESMSSDILEQIKIEYNSKDRYNLLDEIEKSENKRQSSKLYLLIIPVIGIIVLFYIIKSAKED